jgi:mannosyltransferase OCH1-like enzyme
MNNFMFGFACILPLLEFVHVLIKFVWSKDVFVCDLVATIKVYQGDVYNMYCDQISKLTNDSFWAFKSWLELKHENIHMRWIVDVNFGIPHFF